MVEYRQLGRTGVKVSQFCLGSMMFGGETNPAVSGAIIDRALDAGINFLVTANKYHRGRSEDQRRCLEAQRQAAQSSPGN